MNNIRYLLDENVSPIFRTELLKREPEMVIWKIGDILAPPRGTLDPNILEWCEENAFILVTNNRKSMPGHVKQHIAQNRHFPGIIELNPGMTVGESIEELVLIWKASDISEYEDRLIYLPFTL